MSQLVDKVAVALAEGRTMTAKDMAEEFNCTVEHARLMAHRLHRARQSHICAWVRPGAAGMHMPVYMWGDALDVPRPKKVEIPVMPRADRESYATLAKLRTALTPEFDPFRVLRAQVTA